MIKFGKKVNYRPLAVSFLLAITLGIIFGWSFYRKLGIEIGIIIFLLMILGHYLFILPIIFNYWDSDNNYIHYTDIRSIHKRLLSILFPVLLSTQKIDKSQISQINVLGLPQPKFSLTDELIVSEEGGMMYNLYLMINEPIKVRLTMANQRKIDLDISRDYVKHSRETIIKLRIFLKNCNPNIVHLSDDTRKFIQV